MKHFTKLKANWKQILFVTSSAGGIGYLLGKSNSFENINIIKKTEPYTIGMSYGADQYYVPHIPDSTLSKPSTIGPIFSHLGIPSSVYAASKIREGESVLTVQTEDVCQPAPNASRISQIMRFGFPGLSNIRSLDDFVMSYDTKNRIPHWVFEHLTEKNVIKNDAVDRSKSDFHEDLSVHEYFRSSNNDYKKSGYDRGHMAAAGNHRQRQEFCNQTFLLSNMAPQVGRGFNRDKWNELEHYCRKLVRSNMNVYVCTGPLFLPRMESDGNLYVHYKVLGSNHVAVPTHFFKVIVTESSNGEVNLESFILPNVAIEESTPLSAFHVPVDVVERASGLLMFDKINKNMFKRLNGRLSGWF